MRMLSIKKREKRKEKREKRMRKSMLDGMNVNAKVFMPESRKEESEDVVESDEYDEMFDELERRFVEENKYIFEDE